MSAETQAACGVDVVNIKGRCTDCGEVRVPIDKVAVVRLVEPGITTAFGCPECSLRVVMPTRGSVVLDLVGHGARIHRCGAP
jgi:hypothetical protein